MSCLFIPNTAIPINNIKFTHHKYLQIEFQEFLEQISNSKKFKANHHTCEFENIAIFFTKISHPHKNPYRASSSYTTIYLIDYSFLYATSTTYPSLHSIY